MRLGSIGPPLPRQLSGVSWDPSSIHPKFQAPVCSRQGAQDREGREEGLARPGHNELSCHTCPPSGGGGGRWVQPALRAAQRRQCGS